MGPVLGIGQVVHKLFQHISTEGGSEQEGNLSFKVFLYKGLQYMLSCMVMLGGKSVGSKGLIYVTVDFAILKDFVICITFSPYMSGECLRIFIVNKDFNLSFCIWFPFPVPNRSK